VGDLAALRATDCEAAPVLRGGIVTRLLVVDDDVMRSMCGWKGGWVCAWVCVRARVCLSKFAYEMESVCMYVCMCVFM